MYAPKTVYDPNIYTDTQIANLANEAMTYGTVSAGGTVLYGKAGSIDFKGHIGANGEVTSVYPIIK